MDIRYYIKRNHNQREVVIIVNGMRGGNNQKSIFNSEIYGSGYREHQVFSRGSGKFSDDKFEFKDEKTLCKHPSSNTTNLPDTTKRNKH